MSCDGCKSAPKDGRACRYCGAVARDARLERLAEDIGKATKTGADRERIEFIRRAAIAICAQDDEMAPLMAWTYADALWRAKPEDL